MQTLAEIRQTLASYGLAPRKSLGQNFLIDHNLIRKLVDASGVRDGDVVLEVGPGTGTLTEALVDRGCDVIACELDDGLATLLADRFAENDRFTLIHGDCLAGKRSLNAGHRRGDRRPRRSRSLPTCRTAPPRRSCSRCWSIIRHAAGSS